MWRVGCIGKSAGFYQIISACRKFIDRAGLSLLLAGAVDGVGLCYDCCSLQKTWLGMHSLVVSY
jgi:hypothetical protein